MTNTLLAELKQTRPYRSPTEEAYISIVRTAAVLSHAFEEALKPFGVTATQYNVLRILRGAGAAGLCRNAVRDRMVTAVPDVTRLLDRLEQMKLIERERGGSDRRFVTTRITREGTKLLAKMDAPVIAAHDRLLGHMTPADLRALVAMLSGARQAL